MSNAQRFRQLSRGIAESCQNCSTWLYHARKARNLSRIPYTIRRGTIFWFRRRFAYAGTRLCPICISLKTSRPAEARFRASLIAAAFEQRKRMIMNTHPASRGVLTPQEISSLLKEELSLELGIATAGYFDPDRDDAALARSHRIYGEAYRIAAGNGGDFAMIEGDRHRLQQDGWSERDIRTVGLVLKHYCSDDDTAIEARLRAMGLTPTPPLLRQARVQILRARAEAQDRASTFPTAEANSPFDPVGELLAMSGKRTLPVGQVAVTQLQPMGFPSEEGAAVCPFISNDRRKLSVVAEDICDGLVADGVWRAPADQQRRIVKSFVWITGDKAIGDYRQDDASAFKRSLQQLPVTFRWKHADNALFVNVQASLPTLTDEDRRNPKTVNRDLSTMSTFYKAMQKAGPWSTANDEAKVLNFAKLQDGIEEDEDAPPRVPWQERHLRELFSSPIFHGNQGAKKRLLAGASIPQDAAYWAPILIYWTLAAREEICGLEIEDIFLDEPVPYIYLRKNSTRGLKRNARKRRIPIAGEVLRLGFAGYVAALSAKGEKHLFPELYINKVKIGGAQFYGSAWVHLINWLADRSDIPASEAGKEADIHSLRTFGASILDTSTQVNQNVVKDIMGHARQGTTSTKYQKRKLVVGETATLEEMLRVIEGHLPAVTAMIPVAPLFFLPLEQRCKCYSSRSRKIRKPRS